MSLLLDTNILSELRRRAPEPAVLAWSNMQPADSLFISVVTILEIERGILQLDRRDPMQARRLRDWMDRKVLQGFAGRVLSFDTDTARACAALHVPDPRPERDAMIAATALVHAMTLVTRNVADFAPMGVALHNPWQSRLA